MNKTNSVRNSISKILLTVLIGSLMITAVFGYVAPAACASPENRTVVIVGGKDSYKLSLYITKYLGAVVLDKPESIDIADAIIYLSMDAVKEAKVINALERGSIVVIAGVPKENTLFSIPALHIKEARTSFVLNTEKGT
jgi:hypothetical protein